jgi:glutamyl-tRNA synthetase
MGNLEDYVRKMVLENAVKYDGSPSVKSVMSAIMGTRADLRSRASEIKDLVAKMAAEIESMPLERQRELLLEIDPDALKEEKEVIEEEGMPELPGANRWDNIVMRLAPFPSGPLHVGNARMVILNDYYVKKHDGKLILVFDDTIGSAEKVVEPAAYDLIREGLEYLDVEWHDTVYKSDRLDVFYKYAVDLIQKQEAYVCDCDAGVWRNKYKINQKPCPCRHLDVSQNLERWEKMLDGTYAEKEAAVRIKTGMDDPDPAMRDHVILRISETEHPRVGSKYRVWPLLEYSWGIDDHELGISHIIRGKDLVKEGKIEQHIWSIYGWKHPELIYYGRLRFQDATLSKSKSRQEVIDGTYAGWDDPRTWSLQSLEKRGIDPRALRKAMLDLGLSVVDISISMKPVYAENRSLKDAQAPRVFFVENPVWLTPIGIPKDIEYAEAPVHPDFPERGVRKIPIRADGVEEKLGIPQKDFERLDKGAIFRMKDLANFIMKKGEGLEIQFNDLDVHTILDANAPIVHWIPKIGNVPVQLTLIDGSIVMGQAEPSIRDLPVGSFLQFERVGFAKIFDKDGVIKAAFSHK